jgi:hypothetical protein
MVNSDKIKEWFNNAVEALNKYEWFQDLKSRWDELDPQSQNYVRFASFGIACLSVMMIVMSSIWSVHSLKTELSEKRDLLKVIQNANDEMRRLRESTPQVGLSGKDAGPWGPYLETLAATIGLDKTSVTVSAEKAGASTEQTKESLFDVNLKHVNIKQVIRYAFSVENGQRPVKLRNLLIDTKSDPTGYLDATLALSAFSQVEPK